MDTKIERMEHDRTQHKQIEGDWRYLRVVFLVLCFLSLIRSLDWGSARPRHGAACARQGWQSSSEVKKISEVNMCEWHCRRVLSPQNIIKPSINVTTSASRRGVDHLEFEVQSTKPVQYQQYNPEAAWVFLRDYAILGVHVAVVYSLSWLFWILLFTGVYSILKSVSEFSCSAGPFAISHAAPALNRGSIDVSSDNVRTLLK